MDKINSKDIWLAEINSIDRYQFFLKALFETIQSCFSGRYSAFDGQTNTTCCHGIALLAHNLIYSVHKLELKEILLVIENEMPRKNFVMDDLRWIGSLPDSLVDLASLYVLAYASDVDPDKGKYTALSKLKSFSSTNYKFREQIVDALQRHFSTGVAESYQYYSEMGAGRIDINQIPIEKWGIYVQERHLREDIRGVKYAPYVFSMQIILGYLCLKGVKIALIHDYLDSDRQWIDRDIHFLQGAPNGKFKIIERNELNHLEPFDMHQPILVFGGFSMGESNSRDKIKLFLKDFSSLILACDLYCPQFPRVKIDPEFDSSPIIPDEEIGEIFAKHEQVAGLSFEDPGLFCLSHVFPASIQELICDRTNCELSCFAHVIPRKYIPSLSLV